MKWSYELHAGPTLRGRTLPDQEHLLRGKNNRGVCLSQSTKSAKAECAISCSYRCLKEPIRVRISKRHRNDGWLLVTSLRKRVNYSRLAFSFHHRRQNARRTRPGCNGTTCNCRIDETTALSVVLPHNSAFFALNPLQGS